MPRASGDVHDRHLTAKTIMGGGSAPVTVVRAREDLPPPPVISIDPNSTPLEQAQAQRKWLTERLEWASRGGLPEKEIAALAGQVGGAVRLVARLSGALDITEIQIVRSPPFARVRAAFDAALKFDGVLTARQVRERFEAEIARLLGE